MQKKVYFIPGWGETKKFKYSDKLIKAIRKGYRVIPIDYVSKRGTTLSKNIELILKQIKKPTSKDILIGFSMGALFAYILSTRMKFKKVIICSISPVLENDLDIYPKKEISKIFSPTEIKELRRLKYTEPKNVSTYMCGDKEKKETIDKTRWLAKKFKGNLIIVKNTKHELGDKYIKQIMAQLSENGSVS